MFGHKGSRIPLPSPTHSESGYETEKKWNTFGEAVKDLKEEDMHYIELSDRHKYYLNLLASGQYWKHLPKELMEEAMGGAYKLGGGKTGFYRRLSFTQPSPTLVTSPTMPATMLAHPEKLRPLSIEEYARIQQFDDNWKFKGNIRDIYKQIGNAVPSGLGYMAGKTILDYYKGDYDKDKDKDKDREKKNKIPYSRYKNCSDFEFIPAFKLEIQKNKEKNSLGIFENTGDISMFKPVALKV